MLVVVIILVTNKYIKMVKYIQMIIRNLNHVQKVQSVQQYVYKIYFTMYHIVNKQLSYCCCCCLTFCLIGTVMDGGREGRRYLRFCFLLHHLTAVCHVQKLLTNYSVSHLSLSLYFLSNSLRNDPQMNINIVYL